MSWEEDARTRAASLDEALSREAGQRVLREVARRVFGRLRGYLGEQAQLSRVRSDIYGSIKIADGSGGLVSICLGPTFDEGPTSEHFHFDSGARLSFALTLREGRSSSSLVAYRFHYCLPPGRSPEFLRFELRPEPHADPLAEPRCHLHPGLDEVRLPLPVLDPFEVLDRIFFVIEPALLRSA